MKLFRKITVLSTTLLLTIPSFSSLAAENLAAQQAYQQAAELYQYAAEQGDPRAQYMLATLYRTGQGVDQNLAEAAKWYAKPLNKIMLMPQLKSLGCIIKAKALNKILPKPLIGIVKYLRNKVQLKLNIILGLCIIKVQELLKILSLLLNGSVERQIVVLLMRNII
jgi:hypothetical protein